MEGALVHFRCQASAADFRKTGGASLASAMAKRRINSTASELHLPPISSPDHNQSASVLRQQPDEFASLLHSSPDQVMSSARFCNNVCVTSHGPTANMSSTCTLMQTSNFSCVNRQVSQLILTETMFLQFVSQMRLRRPSIALRTFQTTHRPSSKSFGTNSSGG